MLDFVPERAVSLKSQKWRQIVDFGLLDFVCYTLQWGTDSRGEDKLNDPFPVKVLSFKNNSVAF